MTMKKLVITFSDERLITPSGLSLVGQMLGKSNFIKKCNNLKVDGKRSQSQIKNGDILLSYIGLLCQGKTAYDDIKEINYHFWWAMVWLYPSTGLLVMRLYHNSLSISLLRSVKV